MKPSSGPRPRRPKDLNLILSVARQGLAGETVARQGLAVVAGLLCNFHAYGPLPGSTPGSVGAQVLTFRMSSHLVV